MSEPHLEISWLKTFITVARTGSMTEATSSLCRSQSAISMHIKKIEETLGRKVFNREVRRLTLTPAGQELLLHAQRLLGVYSEAMQSLTGSNVQGKISLGIPDDYAVRYLPQVLKAFGEKYPAIEISLFCEPSLTLIPKIESGMLDVAIVTRDISGRGELLFSEQLVWTGIKSTVIKEDHPLPVAVYEYGSEARKKVLAALEQLPSGYRIAYSSPYVAGQIAVVESGMAVAVLTRCSVPEHLHIIHSEKLPALPSLEVVVISRENAASATLNPLLVNEIKLQLQR
ncbi:LysR family transcriptional regulator [Klebsiella sp. B345]|uniref:LysR family transcriptional regulator n=1 Tax=Klebsiella sp. B345 TaxID=2755398 RepID=UPI003DA8D9CC